MSDAVEALRANPLNATSHAEWTPIRAGISADGEHGFTFGYMTTRRADGTVTPGKYLAYWVKGADGWRVAVYRNRARAEGDVSMALLPPTLPTLMAARGTAGDVERHRASLDAAERAFSNEAQAIGLDAAFTKFGTADAVNMGGPATGFVTGAAAIGKAVSEGEPATGSSVKWAPERVIVASSGDLGVTIGTIHPNQPPSDGSPAPRYPFFTIWHRAHPNAPWRYIAE
jgi:ketosteroid isomerase-like protein